MTEAAQIPMPDGIDELVEQMVKVRDKIKEADDAHKAKTKMAREYKEALEARLLAKLNDVGGEAVKTAHGTVYRTTRRSATIADGDVFRSYVIDNAAFDLVDWKANANAVDDFIKQEQTPPPGVNYTQSYTVGVRRA